MILENTSAIIQANFRNSTRLKNEYYFERKSQAKFVVDYLLSGGSGITLFQIRRKGKTSFLLNEVAAYASENAYVFYFSFMKNQNTVLKNNVEFQVQDNHFALQNGFKKALYQFIETTICNQKSKLPIQESNRLKAFRLNFLNCGVDIELDKVSADNFSNVSLSDIFELIDEYASKQILFLFDEFQELAKHKENIGFVRELRTSLDVRKNIHTIFAGSSQNELNAFFNSYNNPFFGFGIEIDFEDFGIEFIDFCCNVFEKKTGVLLSAQEVYALFEKTGKYPSVITDSLNLISFQEEKSLKTLEKAMQRNFIIKEIFAFENLWNSFSTLEQQILLEIFIQGERITALKTREKFSELLKAKVTENQINYALKKFKEQDLIVKKGTKWFIAKPLFQQFLETRL